MGIGRTQRLFRLHCTGELGILIHVTLSFWQAVTMCFQPMLAPLVIGHAK